MDDSESQIALAAFDFLVVFATETIDQLVKFVNETETITFGLNGNADNDLVVTCQLVAKPGTDTAKDYALMADCTTDLIGFYRPGEAIYSQITATPIQAYDQAYLKTLLTAADKLIERFFVIARKDAERIGGDEAEVMEKIMAIAKQVPNVLQQTVDAGKIDFAESITADYTTLMAVKIAGGNAIVGPINELYNYAHLMMAEQLADHGIEEGITLERDTYNGIQLWKIFIPLTLHSGDEDFLDEMRNDENRLFPGTLTYIIGLSDDIFVYAQGFTPTVVDTIKDAIDKSGESVPMPKEIIVFSPDKIKHLVKGFGVDLLASDDEQGQAVMDIIFNIPENANIVVTQEVEGNALTWTTVCDGKLWPTVGRIIYEAQNAEHKVQR
jgi:hypothetical protein